MAKTMPVQQELLEAIRNYCSEIGASSRAIVAGGFIRDHYLQEHQNDMDIFFYDQEALHQFKSLMKDWLLVEETENALTYRKEDKTVQLIRYIFGTPEQIIDSFDFTMCMVALDYDKGMLTEDRDFFKHAMDKKLFYMSDNKPINSLKRVARFTSRGFTINEQEICKIAMGCRDMKEEDIWKPIVY